ncbi:hypothetical protein C8Q74DRAFT_1315844 [Fomes fomentarius]|nr:hypothetical protein C8Q74DRAFT_1315844 [Fomes fomentarius]
MLKALLLVVSALFFALGIIPPRNRVQATEITKLYRGQPFEYVVRSFAYICCAEVTIALFSNAVTLLLAAPSASISASTQLLLPYLCPIPSSLHSALAAYSPRLALGLGFIWSGAALRLWSYHTLGEFFTYEVHVRPDHRLFTSGPYAFVRHPSYTGIALLLIGVQLVQFGDGGYMSTCHAGSGPWMLVARSWQAASAFTMISLFRRCPVEDGELWKRFGDAWTEYSRTVAWRLVPYVL